MFWTKRVVIGDGERGLVYRNRQFERVLGAGVYRIFDPLKRVEVRSFNIASPEYAGHDADALVARLGERLGETFVLASGEAPSLTEWVAEIAAAQGARAPRFRVPVAPMWLLGLSLEVAFKMVGKDAPFSRRSLKFFTNGTVFDPRKIRTVLGFSPAVPWRDGVSRTAVELRRQSAAT